MNVLYLLLKFLYFIGRLLLFHWKYSVVKEGELTLRNNFPESVIEFSLKFVNYFFLRGIHSNFTFLDWALVIFKSCKAKDNIFYEVIREHINEKKNALLKLLIESGILTVDYDNKRVDISDCFKANYYFMNMIIINIPWVSNTWSINNNKVWCLRVIIGIGYNRLDMSCFWLHWTRCLENFFSA